MGVIGGPDIVQTDLVLNADPANSTSFKGQNYASFINTRNWTVTSGSVSGYSQNGSTSENVRAYGEDPWGNQSVIWTAYSDATSGADGGWVTSAYTIDTSQMYRVTVWVKRTVYVDGRWYFGFYNYNSSSSNITAYKRTDGAGSTNLYPYVSSDPPSTGQMPDSTWILGVYHVWPAGSGTGSNYTDSGLYTRAGGKYSGISYDITFNPSAAKMSMRTYLYYSASTAPRQHWCYPRIDLIDGNEPTVQELLDGDARGLYNLASPGDNSLFMISDPVYDSASGSFVLDGAKHYGMLPTSTELELQQFTVSCWVKFDTMPGTGWYYLVSKTQDSYYYGFRMEVSSSGQVYFAIGNGSSITDATSSASTVTTNTWYKIDATYDQSNLIIYVNGVAVKTETPGAVAISYTSTTFMAGYSEVTANREFVDGYLGPIQIYSSALSSAEIVQNFDATKGRYGY